MPRQVLPPPGATGGLVSLDMSLGSSANDSQFDGDTTWGHSSTVKAAASHGRLDSGLDAGVRFSAALTPPSGARGLHVRFTLGTVPGSNPTGGVAELLFGVSGKTTLTTDEGYQAAWRITGGGDVKVSGALDTWGNMLSNGATCTGTPMVCDFFVWLDGSTAVGATLYQNGASTGIATLVDSADLSSSITDLYAYVGVGMVAASPSGTIEWGDVEVSSQWVT